MYTAKFDNVEYVIPNEIYDYFITMNPANPSNNVAEEDFYIANEIFYNNFDALVRKHLPVCTTTDRIDYVIECMNC
jgi:hypothetical protein